ncbi:hypothetical protein [Xanthomonas citri]|jgi:hypothetical protein|nr:hypothetical protein [Xanthomonas citri]
MVVRGNERIFGEMGRDEGPETFVAGGGETMDLLIVRHADYP